MYYVYLIESIPDPNRHYVGFTEDLRKRFEEHNDGNFRPLSGNVRGGLKLIWLSRQKRRL
jgi:predicted GIY-YIG superfamily endonuclease